MSMPLSNQPIMLQHYSVANHADTQAVQVFHKRISTKSNNGIKDHIKKKLRILYSSFHTEVS